MKTYLGIVDVRAREIMDSRGNPTVETEVTVVSECNRKKYTGRAAVPSGASTGKFEAVELRDGGTRYGGMGVKKAVQNVNEVLFQAVLGKNALNQRLIDEILIKKDGSENKKNLGANATLGVSLAVAKAAANALGLPFYQYIGGVNSRVLPIPMMNIMNGGKHADNTVDLQEFMIMPVIETSFTERLRICSEIYHTLKRILVQKGLQTAVGDEGGFAPNLSDSKAVLSLMMEAITTAGYEPDKEIQIAIDAAASELYDEKSSMYYFPGESQMQGKRIMRDTKEMITYYEHLVKQFPICSIEDGLQEEDWEGWKEMTKRMGGDIQLVGDDLFVTNTKRLEKGIRKGCGNAILVKVNQIGTLTESLEAIEMAKKNGYQTVISHRSGETEDTTIADISVAINAGQIKTGAPCRTDRVAKYNQLLRIEEEMRTIK